MKVDHSICLQGEYLPYVEPSRQAALACIIRSLGRSLHSMTPSHPFRLCTGRLVSLLGLYNAIGGLYCFSRTVNFL